MRILICAAALWLACCSKPAKPPESVQEQRYPMTGEIVSLDAKTQTARIRHEEIKGWMEAMTMDFPVKEKSDFDRLKPGDRIAGTVFVHDIDYRLGEIKVQPK